MKGRVVKGGLWDIRCRWGVVGLEMEWKALVVVRRRRQDI